MAHQRDKWFAATAAAFVLSALTACNRGDDKSSEPRVVELPVPAAVTSTAQAQPVPGEVKRYGAQEQVQTGSVRVAGDSVKVYAEADNKGQPAQELTQSTLVERKASFGQYSLVAYPTPKGDTDLGWVLTSDLASSPEGAAAEGAAADTTTQKATQTTAASLAAAKTATQTAKADTKTDKKADTKTDKKADTKTDKKADTKTDKKADTKTDKKKTDAKADDASKTANADAVKKAADDAAKVAADAAKAAADAVAKAGGTTSTAKTSKKK
jgi:hypothetical protein